MSRNRRPRKKRYRLFKWLVFLLILIPALAVGSLYGASWLAGPPPLNSEHRTVYYSKDDEVLGGDATQESAYVPLNRISKNLIDATITVEDRNFYTHHGFDVMRIGGAIVADIRHMSLKQGASTLTQQYARNLYLSHEKTWSRKAKEAYYTARLEMFYSKSQILEGYLNMIYYGHGAYGIEAASQLYFGKDASGLSLAEAAMLAGIPKGPKYYSPFNDKDRALTRQKQILKMMAQERIITEAEYIQAANQTLALKDRDERKKEEPGPYFQDMVQQEAASIMHMDNETFRSGGYRVYTTLDPAMQESLDAQISEHMDPASGMEAGAVAMDPRTGEIRALAGGRDYGKSTYNRAVSSIRMPGSTFKPFLYYAALEKGYSPSTPLMSKPTTFELEDGKLYEPGNYNGYYANKPITLAQALALSDNIYAVKTNIFLNPQTLVDTARTFGITSKLAAVPSLALGTYEVSVKEMVTGYSMIANGGKEIKPHTIRKIVSQDGEVLFEEKASSGKQVLDRRKAFVLAQMMTGVFDRALDGHMAVTGASIADKLTQAYAGKSGSTNSDSWMIGFSPELAMGVWTGYDSSQAITNPAEMAYAKNIWAGFMEAAHKDKKPQPLLIPAGVVAVDIDPETGLRATPYCKKKRTMYFEKGTVPTQYCTMHMHGDMPANWFDEENENPLKKEQPKKDKEPDKKKRKELFDKWRKFMQ